MGREGEREGWMDGWRKGRSVRWRCGGGMRGGYLIGAAARVQKRIDTETENNSSRKRGWEGRRLVVFEEEVGPPPPAQ